MRGSRMRARAMVTRCFCPPLSLPPPSPTKGIQPLGQVLDELVQVRKLGDALHLLVAHVFQPVDDVLADGSRKEDTVLRHDGDKMPVIGQGKLCDVVPVYVQRALRRLQKADDEVHQRGLAAPRRADHGDALPFFSRRWKNPPPHTPCRSGTCSSRDQNARSPRGRKVSASPRCPPPLWKA